MVEQAAQRITDYLRNRVDDGLRTVVIVTDDGFNISYLSDALRREYSRETFGEVIDSFRLRNPLFNPGIEGKPIGERRAIVHYHENAFVIQLPYSEAASILISVNPDVGRDLLGFIEQCRKLVQSPE